ncbi:hypothetical protein LB542_19850 [Mesorhizobium sp. BR1-1-9]|uniref:hypothetical protein n=1 Tax=Mesorhizobium sp. BR1-1-9 TaxID=2876646 RepID=UPI001CD12EA9|nr:hypothetical protein [Mesorhizobium sp. BR1-1-9]MBZ9873105.1 hypothetical protein [Mesorhizobium sp. BR1-1-9]
MSARDWYSGMQVVCIDDGFDGYARYGRYSVPTRIPMLNEVLTIRELQFVEEKNGVFLSFEEIDKTQTDGPLSADIKWTAHFFRPLISKKIEIGIFTAMLTKQGVDA